MNPTGVAAIEGLAGLKEKMYSFLVDDNSKHKKANLWIEMLLQVITNIKMYCWTINVWDTQWVEFKVKTIEQKHLKSKKFHCLGLITKCLSKTVDMMD